MILSLAEFDNLVAEALDLLPAYFREKMENVEVLVKPWPSKDELRRVGVPSNHTLLGLYTGIPLTERNHAYGLVLPDTITLYQGPIENAAGSRGEIVHVVRHTVVHEIAHHFGISDDRLHELGAY